MREGVIGMTSRLSNASSTPSSPATSCSTRPPTTGSPTKFSQGTWAIHRPGWYGEHHAAMRRPEGRVLLAGSDIANGWAGFIDGAIESGLTVGAAAAALSG
jgi:Flavin containing amine oxidoreductase